MSTRTRTANAYESTLNGSITNSATSFAVTSGAGLVQPLYLVIDPDVPASREFIRVGVVAGNNLSSVTRGLTGSTSGAVSHLSGAVIRAVVTSQLVGDIFTDIETLEAADVTHAAAGNPHPGYATDTDLANHLAAGDPHAVYATDADLTTHAGAANPHSVYALDTDLTTHAGAANPHTVYALDTDLSAHVAAANPHPAYALGFLTQDTGPTSDQLVDSGTMADLVGISCTINPATTRKIKLTLLLECVNEDDNEISPSWQIVDSVDGIMFSDATTFVQVPALDLTFLVNHVWIGTAAAGSRTYTVQVSNNFAGTANTIRFRASQSRLIVEDVGAG